MGRRDGPPGSASVRRRFVIGRLQADDVNLWGSGIGRKGFLGIVARGSPVPRDGESAESVGKSLRPGVHRS